MHAIYIIMEKIMKSYAIYVGIERKIKVNKTN